MAWNTNAHLRMFSGSRALPVEGVEALAGERLSRRSVLDPGTATINRQSGSDSVGGTDAGVADAAVLSSGLAVMPESTSAP
jgi:hypothetical protein